MKQKRNPRFNPTQEQLDYLKSRIGNATTIDIAKELKDKFNINITDKALNWNLKALGMANTFYLEKKRKGQGKIIPNEAQIKHMTDRLYLDNIKKIAVDLEVTEYVILNWLKDHDIYGLTKNKQDPRRKGRRRNIRHIVGNGYFNVNDCQNWIV